MSEAKITKEFEELLGLYIDDELEGQRLRDFVKLVKSDTFYLNEVKLQLQVDKKLEIFENEDYFCDEIEDILNTQEDEFTDNIIGLTREPTIKRSSTPWYFTAASLAATIFMGVILYFNQLEIIEEIDEGVAVISSLAGTINLNLEKGDTVKPGLLELKEGYMSLEFYGGARMSIAAPAKLEIINSMKVKCYSGKIRANVPPVAKGFTVMTPESEVVDLGTEFGLDIGEKGETEIHVFDGEVEAYDADGSMASKKLLIAGEAMNVSNKEQFSANMKHFDDLLEVSNMERDEVSAKFHRWQTKNEELKSDERLIAYYDFETQNKNNRILKNKAITGKKMNGAIIGAEWSEGPWPDKQALEFKRPGDRVRLNIPGKYKSITFSAWVRLDGLDRNNSSLLLTDGYDKGELHWQFKNKGTLVLGINHDDIKRITYVSKPVVNLKKLGQWIHLVTVVDHERNEVRHYRNAKEMGRRRLETKDPHVFGFSSIGNWDKPILESGSIRNLNGAIADLSLSLIHI